MKCPGWTLLGRDLSPLLNIFGMDGHLPVPICFLSSAVQPPRGWKTPCWTTKAGYTGGWRTVWNSHPFRCANVKNSWNTKKSNWIVTTLCKAIWPWEGFPTTWTISAQAFPLHRISTACFLSKTLRYGTNSIVCSPRFSGTQMIPRQS